MFFLSGVGYGISSSIGVECTGIVSGDGISSTVTISDGFFSLSSICPHDLVLTQVGLALWLTFVFLGDAMVWNIKCFLGLYGLCVLCEFSLCFSTSIALCFLFFHE
jgi:hypothetical protein